MWLSVRLALLAWLILSVSGVKFLSSRDYEDILEKKIWSLEEKLNLVAPTSVLNNYKSSLTFFDESELINNTCFRDLILVGEALRLNQSSWALKMVDASSKIPSGIFEGNIIDLGQYDECVDVHGERAGVEIQGRHCMYSVDFEDAVQLLMKPQLSICVPARCEADDLLELFNRTIEIIQEKIHEKIGNKIKLGVSISSVTCTTVDVVAWDTWFIVCICLFVILVGFLLVCSLCDLMNRRLDDGERSKHRILATFSQFSLLKNGSAILSTKVKRDNLPAIHGIRFLSMAWVVLGHEYFMPLFGVNVNIMRMLDWTDSWRSLYIFIAPFAVDTFFTISGFLMTYLFLKQMPKQKSFNLPMYYFHRYFRLTPTVLTLIIFTIVFVPKIGSGPRWETVSENVLGKCRTGWWSVLLYVQNFVDNKAMCLGHLWYLAVDMQLFWISPIILYPLYKKPKLGLAILTLFFVVSIVVPATIVGYNQYPIVSYMRRPNMAMVVNGFQEVYMKPYCRAGPWLVGIFLGYEVACKSRKLKKFTMYLGWLLAILAFAFCTFGTKYFMMEEYEYDVALETFFGSVSRPIWGFGVCWIIFACINNWAGPVTKFLNWKCFLPLSRLSYCVYLVHLVIQITEAASIRVPTYFSDFRIWHYYLSDLIICVVIAFFFSLLIESPLLVLEKMILRRKQESHSDSQKNLTCNGVDENGREK